MSDKLIWQSDDNLVITEVVYDSIYGMPIEKCMEILWKYAYGQLISVEWIEDYMENNKANLSGFQNLKDFENNILKELIKKWGAEYETENI